MTSIDLLTFPGVFQTQGFPTSRLQPKQVEQGFKGIIWVTKCDVLKRLHEAGQKVIVNTRKAELLVGDYGGVHMDDGGYWIVCDAKTMDRGWGMAP